MHSRIRATVVAAGGAVAARWASSTRTAPMIVRYALLALGFSLVPQLAQGQNANEQRRGPVLSVRGVGLAQLKPDYAQLDASVTTRGRTLDEAATAHEERATRALALLNQLKPNGLTIERSSFTINQDRPPPPALPSRGGPTPSKPPEPQFAAATTFSLRLKPIDEINVIMSKMAESGLFNIRSVRYRVEQERAALNQARRTAMSDAREQASAYAEAGDLRLIEIIEVTDGEASPSLDGQADMPLPRYVQIVPPATVEFNATVNVTWRIVGR